MNLAVSNPNFSVVMTEDCNAKCKFCYVDQNHSTNLTVERFEEVAKSLPRIFEQCTFTGGETTMMKDLSKWIKIANKRFNKVVLNTNGTWLTNDIAMSVDHVNISRHHYDELANKKIFGTGSVPDATQIWEICQVADVTLNCFLPDNFDDLTFIANYIRFAKHVGAKVAFRKNYSNLKVLPVDMNDTLIDQHSCGACLHRYHRIAGCDVTFKYSVPETHEHMNGIYELILQANGSVTYDWAGEKNFTLINDTWTLDGKTDALVFKEDIPDFLKGLTLDDFRPKKLPSTFKSGTSINSSMIVEKFIEQNKGSSRGCRSFSACGSISQEIAESKNKGCGSFGCG